MARTRYVSRTILSTECEVMTVNTTTKEIGSVVVAVQGSYEDKADKKLEKEVRKGFDALALEDTAFVAITDIHTAEKKYRMLESLYMSLAEVVGEDAEDDGDDTEDGEE